MSFTQNGKVLPIKITDKMVAVLVARALRHEHANSDAAIKRIERITGANPNSICKWYQGRNAPNAAHLLLLAKHYPSILRMMLEMIERTDIWEIYKPDIVYQDTERDGTMISSSCDIYSAKSCTINTRTDAGSVGKLNPRQIWFLESLKQGHNIKIANIVSMWKISSRAAKYDVAGLIDFGLIRFIGSRKTGRYIPIIRYLLRP